MKHGSESEGDVCKIKTIELVQQIKSNSWIEDILEASLQAFRKKTKVLTTSSSPAHPRQKT
jgi:hypothetical protein